MTTVFSCVEADIASDLVSRFPSEFDFDAMLKKVCEDADVVVVGRAEDGGVENKPYRLKGLWLAMEKAYKHLVTTVALYGSRHPDGISGQAKDLDLKWDAALSVSTEVSLANGNEMPEVLRDDYHVVSNENVLTEICDGSVKKKTRRPRKSQKQNRNVETSKQERISLKADSDALTNPEALDLEKDSGIKEKGESSNPINNEDFESVMDCNEEATEEINETLISEVVGEESEKPRKRCRSRKNETPLHVSAKDTISAAVKKRSQNKCKVTTPINSGDYGDLPPVRKRGRPKVYNDEGQTEFPCPDCSFVAKKRSKLRTHTIRMHLSSPTKCDLCPKVFPNKRYMHRHRASHVEPQHCCDVCGKMYKIRKAMLDHRQTHETSYEKPSFKCDHCSKHFCNRYILDCHIKDIHLGQKKSYLCSVCGKSFTTKHSLTEHSNAHTGIKPHVCEVCGKSFSYESALRDHKFTHAEEKQFWCQHCQKGFTQRSGLKMHMRIHKQNKMFICSECGRGFTQKQALQRHERVHKGEKPFICKHCGKFFTDASIIRRHLILVHKIHKDAKSWREDIVCTVKPASEHHVQKKDEVDDPVSEAEKEKEAILKAVGATMNSRPQNKGPSRAFARTYPRRVAILDDDGNVLAPPEVPSSVASAQRKKSTSAETNSSVFRPKTLVASSNTNFLLTDGSSELDPTAQVLNPRYLDSSQWDALASQLARGSGTHIEHIILEDTSQHELQRGMETGQGLHKIIKYENVSNLPAPATRATHILSQTEFPAAPSPSTSPLPFSVQPSSSQTRVLDTHLDVLNPQMAHSGAQYFDGRTGNPSGNAWSSVYYYSQLASQFGMSINTDYSYVGPNNSTGGTASHLSPYITPSASEAHTGAATLILQSQPHSLLNKDGQTTERDILQPESPSHSLSSQPAVLPDALDHSQSSTLSENSLQGGNPQDIIHVRQIGLRLTSSTSGSEGIHPSGIMLHPEFPVQHHSPSENLDHVRQQIENLTETVGLPQSIMVQAVSIGDQGSVIGGSAAQTSPRESHPSVASIDGMNLKPGDN